MTSHLNALFGFLSPHPHPHPQAGLHPLSLQHLPLPHLLRVGAGAITALADRSCTC